MKKSKWTDDIENDLIRFVSENDLDKKNEIFSNKLIEPLEDEINCVYDRYGHLELSKEDKEDILTRIYEEVQKFNIKKIKNNRSGFSYVRTIIRCSIANIECKYIKEKRTLTSLDVIKNL